MNYKIFYTKEKTSAINVKKINAINIDYELLFRNLSKDEIEHFEKLLKSVNATEKFNEVMDDYDGEPRELKDIKIHLSHYIDNFCIYYETKVKYDKWNSFDGDEILHKIRESLDKYKAFFLNDYLYDIMTNNIKFIDLDTQLNQFVERAINF